MDGCIVMFVVVFVKTATSFLLFTYLFLEEIMAFCMYLSH